MDMISNPELLENTLPETTYAINVIDAFNQYADKIKILSLDCFDTLLWRNVAAPADVFYDLQHKPTFKSLGFSSAMRIRSEFKARRLNLLKKNSSEVQLNDIYRAAFPNLTPDQLHLLAEEELAAEMEACYAFPTVVELIRTAHTKGIKIIIVSDIYFLENQLRQLLQHCLPEDAMTAISFIFTSCEYDDGKFNGLFTHVLNKLNLSPEAILHIGDNFKADFEGPRKHKMHALHLIQHNDKFNELLRMQATSAAILEPSIRHQRGLKSPFKSILASAKISHDKPEELIGYASLGQIMYAFGRYLCDEIEELKRAGKKPKVAFIMRDAYLPYLACEALSGQLLGKRVRINRFASYASTFCTQDDVDNYLIDVINSGRFEDISRPLLLPKEVVTPLIKMAERAPNPEKAFIDLIHRDEILQIIFKESKKYRERLKRHIKKEVNLQPGDTLVLVDLGYSGTTQHQLEPILCKEMGIEMTGRYLIALSVPGWENSRRGLMDASWCDERTLATLVTYIALLEQVCTSTEPSILDFDEEGNAIYSEASLSQHQQNKLDRLQAECLRFVRDADHYFKNSRIKISPTHIREAAMSELGRLLFFPSETEIKYFEDFEFDLNMGTKDVFRVFDQNQGLSSLRKRGLFFTFMEKAGKSFRTNSPAEMRSAGLELTLALITHHRFGLDFSLKDINLRREKINIILARGRESAQSTIEAMATHSDYFSMWVPVSHANLQVGILFGQKYRWLQFESAELIDVKAFFQPSEPVFSEDCWSSMIFNEMEHHGDKLYECKSNNSFMMMAPQNKPEDKKYLLRVVFRPTVIRRD